jgi:hypothetical protein
MKSIHKMRKSSHKMKSIHKMKKSSHKMKSRRKSSKRVTKKRRAHKNRRSTRRHMKNKIHRRYKGGNMGEPWSGGDVAKWPGVSGPHDGNHYEYKGSPSGMYDPPMPSNQQFQNGGGILNLLPQDLVNFGRSLSGGLAGVYDSYQGQPRFDSSYPLPTDQPSMDREILTPIKYKPLDLNKIHIRAGNTVSDI